MYLASWLSFRCRVTARLLPRPRCRTWCGAPAPSPSSSHSELAGAFKLCAAVSVAALLLMSSAAGSPAASQPQVCLPPSPPSCSYPEVCFRLQAALPEAVGCYRMAHVEEEEEGQAEEGSAQQQQQAVQGGSSAAAAAASKGQPSGAATAEDSSLVAQEERQEQAEEQERERERRTALHAHGKVVFLFKLVEGIAPASFGLNVARMAQLPSSVLQRAAAVAARVQAEAEQRQQQQQQPGGGAVEGLADECRRWLQRSLVAAADVDVAVGQQLQQRARQLLAISG